MSECKKMLPNLTIVSILLIRFNIKFYEKLRVAASRLIPCFLTNFLTRKSHLSLSNAEILCEEHVKLETYPGYCLWVGIIPIDLIWCVIFSVARWLQLRDQMQGIKKVQWLRMLRVIWQTEQLPHRRPALWCLLVLIRTQVLLEMVSTSLLTCYHESQTSRKKM